MSDDLTTEQRDLREAEQAWHEAQLELAKCRRDAQYDTGYVCWEYAEREKAAGLEFFRCMDAYIDARVRIVILQATAEQGS